MVRQLKKEQTNRNKDALLSLLIDLLSKVNNNYEGLRKQNETLVLMVKELQNTVDKQTSEFRAAVTEMQTEQQHLQTAMQQTKFQHATMHSSIQQLINTCDRLNEENKSLKMQLKKITQSSIQLKSQGV